MTGRARWQRWLGLTAVCIAVLGMASMDAAAGARLVVNVSEPFEFDGNLYEPGRLAVKPVSYNPSSTLNEVWIGNRCLGMVVSHNDRGPEVPEAENAAIFERSARGRLVLVGYLSEENGRVFAHRFSSSGSPAGTATDPATSISLAAR